MGVLVQNKGKQAAVVSSITAFREKSGIHSLQLASAHPEFGPLLTDVSRTVSDQPLNYLQNFGGGNDEFLFERFAIAKIRLKPGVAYCLRRFYPLVQQLARSHWIEHIKANRQNLHISRSGSRSRELSVCFFEAITRDNGARPPQNRWCALLLLWPFSNSDRG